MMPQERAEKLQAKGKTVEFKAAAYGAGQRDHQHRNI